MDAAALHQLTALGECLPHPVFYLSVPGPLSPTDAELRLMAPAGAYYGNSSLALAYAAQQAGIIIAVIACDPKVASADCSLQQMCKAAASLGDVDTDRKMPIVGWNEGLSYVTPR